MPMLALLLFPGFSVASSPEAGFQSDGVRVPSRQAKTIKGVVTDETGEPMIGVNVLLVGSGTGVITDINGEYSIQAGEGSTLEFSYVGYPTVSLPLSGLSNYDVSMTPSLHQLGEVVVTAMGIERAAKSLTYSTQTIKSDEITRIKEPNFINSLQGKSAGLLITPNNSGAGGGATKIVLRGQTSILGTNQPLIVLDGVPIASGASGQTTELLSGAGRDGGDLLSTINPDDISSLTILKGPNAAALYGSSANNGVIIINTKRGEQGKVKVSISSSTSVETMFIYPKTQTVYGLTPNATLEAWGPRISELTSDDLASRPYYTGTPRDPVKDFFDNGVTLHNGITLSGGTEMARSYFSYGNTMQWGMQPNNKFSRHNFLLKQSFSLFKKRLDLDFSMNYIHQETKNRPVAGRVLSPLHALYRMPSNVDMRYFKNHYKHVGTLNDAMVTDEANGNRKLLGHEIQSWYWYDQHLNNPYWLVNMHNDHQIKDRLIGNLSLRLRIWRDLFYQSRLNSDMNFDNGLNTEFATSMRESQGRGGQYWSGNSRSTEFFNDHMLTYNERFSDRYELSVAAGTSFSRSYSRSRSIRTIIDISGVPNAFTPENSAHSRPGNPSGSATSATDSYDNRNWSTALFATASLGLWDKVYLDGSYRLEWAKSFQQFARADEYIHFDYYSAGANMLLDRFFPSKPSFVNQVKLRGSWSVVGTPVPNFRFGRQTINWSNGSVTPRPPLFDDAKPERTTSYEGGLEVWLFDNALDFDITYYNSTLKDQFLNISTGSGESKSISAGKIQNYGVEFAVNHRWIIDRSWRWTTGFNIAYNRNRILETYRPSDGSNYEVQTGPASFKIKYLKGGAYGDIYVNSFERNPDGSIKVNNAGNYADAVPQMASGQYKTFVGNATARVNYGWNNTFFWKNFSLYFLIDGKIGGKVMSLTEPDRDYYGLSERSAHDRLYGERVVQDGREYVLKSLPDGQKVSVEKYYRTIGSNPMEEYVYDATNIRLRDVSLSYTFPRFIGDSDLTASLTVKNVCFLYRRAPIDPDISLSTANGMSGIDSYSLPTTRSFGLNLKLNF